MLSCKQFVEQTTDHEEYQTASFGKKFQINFHKFLCRHCRRYQSQFVTTTEVAKKLKPESAPDVVVEQAVAEMKKNAEQA